MNKVSKLNLLIALLFISSAHAQSVDQQCSRQCYGQWGKNTDAFTKCMQICEKFNNSERASISESKPCTESAQALAYENCMKNTQLGPEKCKVVAERASC